MIVLLVACARKNLPAALNDCPLEARSFLDLFKLSSMLSASRRHSSEGPSAIEYSLGAYDTAHRDDERQSYSGFAQGSQATDHTSTWMATAWDASDMRQA